MQLADFAIGKPFKLGDHIFHCTDVGSRVVVAVPAEIEVSTSSGKSRVDDAIAGGWLNGPPYAAAELVFDEYDLERCEPIAPTQTAGSAISSAD